MISVGCHYSVCVATTGRSARRAGVLRQAPLSTEQHRGLGLGVQLTVECLLSKNKAVDSISSKIHKQYNNRINPYTRTFPLDPELGEQELLSL